MIPVQRRGHWQVALRIVVIWLDSEEIRQGHRIACSRPPQRHIEQRVLTAQGIDRFPKLEPAYRRCWPSKRIVHCGAVEQSAELWFAHSPTVFIVRISMTHHHHRHMPLVQPRQTPYEPPSAIAIGVRRRVQLQPVDHLAARYTSCHPRPPETPGHPQVSVTYPTNTSSGDRITLKSNTSRELSASRNRNFSATVA